MGASSVVVHAQASPPQAFTLEQAIQYAVDHYPTVRAALEEVNASTASVRIAQDAYLPRLDALWQSNPRNREQRLWCSCCLNRLIPAMSGPVLPSTSGVSVWGKREGALFSWEPIDFGLRRAGGPRSGRCAHIGAGESGAHATSMCSVPSAMRSRGVARAA
jgi:outer membrane protein TolC